MNVGTKCGYEWITSAAEELGKASGHELAYSVVENNV